MKNLLWLFTFFLIAENCLGQIEYRVKKKPVVEEMDIAVSDSVEDLDAIVKKYKWYSKDSKRTDTNNIVIELSNKAKDTMYLSTMPVKIRDMLGFRIGGYQSLVFHCEIMVINPTTSTTYRAPSDNGYIMDNTCDRLIKMRTTKQGQAVISDFYYKDVFGQVTKLNKTLVILP